MKRNIRHAIAVSHAKSWLIAVKVLRKTNILYKIPCVRHIVTGEKVVLDLLHMDEKDEAEQKRHKPGLFAG